MPVLLDKIRKDLIDAQKQREELRVSTLRFLLSAVKNREIELRPLNKEMNDEEVVTVVSKQIKRRKESIVEFEKGNRKDLAVKEQKEIDMLVSYLPSQLSKEEVRKLVLEAVSESGAKSASEMGKVMSILMPKVKGRVDGGLVSRLVREKLK